MINKIRIIDPVRPRPSLIREAAAAVKAGGVIAFPTRCLYGLGADALNDAAVERVFDLKQRPFHKPLLVLIGRKEQLDRLVKSIPPPAACLMEKMWPGRVTIIFEAQDDLPRQLTGGTGKIGVRLCGHAVAAALTKAVQGPLTGTSANLSGGPGCSRIADLEPVVAAQLDLILDAGPLRGGVGSTVVDVTGNYPKVLREGEVSAEEILALLGRR
ncbi:MAG: threonylcarbamoyl-AMP synthase [Desulfobacterales bacterium]|nr:MAG: threonylcarbamoyl-AMP synthase [Desulfobacterales bacterium]